MARYWPKLPLNPQLVNFLSNKFWVSTTLMCFRHPKQNRYIIFHCVWWIRLVVVYRFDLRNYLLIIFFSFIMIQNYNWDVPEILKSAEKVYHALSRMIFHEAKSTSNVTYQFSKLVSNLANHPLVQWAAVITVLPLISDPPQRYLPPS